MKLVTVKRYEAKDKQLWDDFISSAKNATFLFQRNFMEYHSNRFEDYSLMCFKNEKLIAVLPAHKLNTKVYSHQGLTYGAMVLQKTTSLFEAFESYKAILLFLNQREIKYLNIKVIPTFYNIVPADELEYFLFKSNAKLLKKDVLMVIDYRHQLGFKKNRREGINKALRNGLSIKIEQSYDTFWNEILIPNLERKHQVKPVHSLDEIRQLAAKFPANIQQVNVYQGDKLVAGSTVFLTKTTIHPQYVSGNLDKNSNGSLDLLYDYIINHYQKEKHYFDFNISSEQNGQLLNKGLIFWKEGCGARSYVASTYEVATAEAKHLKLNIK